MRLGFGQFQPQKEVVPIDASTVIMIALLCIAFATLVVKIIEVARFK